MVLQGFVDDFIGAEFRCAPEQKIADSGIQQNSLQFIQQFAAGVVGNRRAGRDSALAAGAAALRILEDQLGRLAPDAVSPGPGTSS
ncbi:hypothetical protein Abr02nite_43940 [Paractinoplanes brasiliensis]|nr:hypothetical protein Abr02nite_43940 [Actinoplanes brasiliensis]